MRFVSAVLVAATAAALAGCDSGPKFAPVSGRVTYDGKPLANAFVEFSPVSPGGGGDPGPGSVGKTDAEGRYTLHSGLDKDVGGAVVGKHKVRISTADGSDSGGDRDADSGAGKKRKAAGPVIPDRYFGNTTLSFDVPPGGTDGANFDLTK